MIGEKQRDLKKASLWQGLCVQGRFARDMPADLQSGTNIHKNVGGVVL